MYIQMKWVYNMKIKVTVINGINECEKWIVFAEFKVLMYFLNFSYIFVSKYEDPISSYGIK